MRLRTCILAVLCLLFTAASCGNPWRTIDAIPAGAAMVTVDGDASAAPIPPGVGEQEARRIRAGWNTVAVLRTIPGAHIGFSGDGITQLSKEPIPEGGMARYRIGRENVTFFADSPGTPLDLVARTSIDDPRFRDVPLR